jgi:hypothetical protein
MFEPSVTVPISYCAEWMDGYGARGWKIDMTVDDPEIIASTSETGLHIPTSVLIHDILDHYLCGLPPSGHRNEAIALHQLALRTGADPLPDLAQMVDEDLIHGHVLGETMHTSFRKTCDSSYRKSWPRGKSSHITSYPFLVKKHFGNS